MGYSDILEAVKQLPHEQFIKLKAEIDKTMVEREDQKIKKESIKELLLNGPTMTDEEYKEYLENRKHFRAWRKKKLF